MRNRTKLGALTIATFILAGAILALSADSSRASDPSPSKPNSPPPPTLIFNRKLISTSNSLDSSVVAIGSSFVAIDSPINFTCPAGGCTLAAELHVQANGSTSANRFAICARLDGATMDPGCPFQGILPADGTFMVGSWVNSKSGVSAGNHTFQSFIYTDNGGQRGEYNITYRLYKP